MIVIQRGATVGGANPLLWFAYQTEGRLTDLEELGFQVWQIQDESLGGSQVQVFPEVAGARESVSVEAYPTGGRISEGRYAATWTAPDTSGQFFVRWFWKTTATADEQSVDKRFEVASIVGFSPIYCGIAELRAECIEATDLRLFMAATIASQLIDKITGRQFGARYATQRHDGRGARAQLLWEPVIGIDRVAIDTEPASQGDLEVSITDLRVYNRHLAGLRQPDDRNDPRIEFVHSTDLYGIDSRARFMPAYGISLQSFAFPMGTQNVEIRGLFGYTDPDGSPWGEVPVLISHAAKMIAAREVGGIGEAECRTAAREGWRVTSEKTRDQSITYAQPAKWGQWIGDPDIDSILSMYLREPMFGSA